MYVCPWTYWSASLHQALALTLSLSLSLSLSLALSLSLTPSIIPHPSSLKCFLLLSDLLFYSPHTSPISPLYLFTVSPLVRLFFLQFTQSLSHISFSSRLDLSPFSLIFPLHSRPFLTFPSFPFCPFYFPIQLCIVDVVVFSILDYVQSASKYLIHINER